MFCVLAHCYEYPIIQNVRTALRWRKFSNTEGKRWWIFSTEDQRFFKS